MAKVSKKELANIRARASSARGEPIGFDEVSRTVNKVKTRQNKKAVKEARKRAKKARKQVGLKRTKKSRPILMGVVGLLSMIFIMSVVSFVVLTQSLSSANQEWVTTGEDISTGELPSMSVMLDANGDTITRFYDQYRIPVSSEEISPVMKQAMVAIEDNRFYEHQGVDFKGIARAAVNNLQGGNTQGASTINMQLAKTYRYLVTAQTDEEREEAIATTSTRKFKDIQTALKLDETMEKDEILTRYLNLVPFPSGAYGVQAAAQTMFGVNASELTLPQAALLAGSVQSPEYNNPFTYPDNALNRRNDVLNSMRGVVPNAEIDQALSEPLGVLPEANRVSKGCTGANPELEAGFFCQHVVNWMDAHGIGEQDLMTKGFTIQTTLNPEVQRATLNAVRTTTDPQGENVQTVSSFVNPGEGREILSMASSRAYGLDESLKQTTLLTPASQVGAGGGSTFKVFTAATSLQQGRSIDDKIDNPSTAVVYGLGTSGGSCPVNAWCVSNLGDYENPISLKDALSHSPNAAFANLIGEVGVGPTVTTAVELGLRGYAFPQPGTDVSIQQQVTDGNQGSFTLGSTPVNALEMSNVAATLASEGRWCEPSPVVSIADNGEDIPLQRPACEQVMAPSVANDLAEGMSDDTIGGTAAGMAKQMGWTAPMSAKTGTTSSFLSSSFFGYIPGKAAGYVYTFSDGQQSAPLCWTGSQVVSCAGGSSYGGQGPAKTWMMVGQSLGWDN